jgi:hypothetical protein
VGTTTGLLTGSFRLDMLGPIIDSTVSREACSCVQKGLRLHAGALGVPGRIHASEPAPEMSIRTGHAPWKQSHKAGVSRRRKKSFIREKLSIWGSRGVGPSEHEMLASVGAKLLRQVDNLGYAGIRNQFLFGRRALLNTRQAPGTAANGRADVNDADVVIVGGGHNGLVAATLLARKGLQAREDAFL